MEQTALRVAHRSGRKRRSKKHAVSIFICVSEQRYMETNNLEVVEEVQRSRERMTYGSEQNCSAASATAAAGTGTRSSIMRF